MICPGGASLIASATRPSASSTFCLIRSMNSWRDISGVVVMARISLEKGGLVYLD
jgi:hypothetical protein